MQGKRPKSARPKPSDLTLKIINYNKKNNK